MTMTRSRPTSALVSTYSTTSLTTSGFYDDLSMQLGVSDLCVVSEYGDEGEIPGVEFTPGLGESISAGQRLTFTALGGTYVTLECRTLTNPAGFLVYGLPDAALAGLPPVGLALDIPGDVFPAFSNVAVPDLPVPLTDFSPPLFGSVGASTVFSWTPSGVAGARILLAIVGDAKSIGCLLVDDGSFTLPDSVTAQLTGTFDGFHA